MDQKQSIGNSNQHKGLPDELNQDTKTTKPLEESFLQYPVKPSARDDEGNLQSQTSKEIRGYSEAKPTESWSQVRPADDPAPTATHPEQQGEEINKVYGAGTDRFTEGKPIDALPVNPASIEKEQQRKEAQGERD